MLHAATSRKTRGFTLIEILVVVAIIALLISILLPSLRTAREEAKAVACQSGLKQIMLGLHMYQTDYSGSLPPSVWSETDWYLAKKDLWFYKLGTKYLPNPKIWVCPGDPFGARFDYTAMKNGRPHTNAAVPSCGYGMNYLLRHSGLGEKAFNIERYPPKRPMNTILLAEVGPDHVLENAPLYANDGAGQAWRDAGRLVWDDGNRPWYSGPTWLTARHNGSINMSTMGGSVQRVPTLKQVRSRPRPEYDDCKRGDCYFCKYKSPSDSDRTHYSFASSQLYWWTGPRTQH